MLFLLVTTVLQLSYCPSLSPDWVFLSFPCFSIKHRTTILQRGLADRAVNVSTECLKLMKEQWLANSCEGDPITFLKYLDVETYESVAESALEVLLSEGLIMPSDDKSIQQYILSADGETRGLLKSGQ